MAEVVVIEINQQNFQVTVAAASTTTHEVSVPTAYAQKLTGGKITTTALVKKSFEFLLERESNTSILRRFDLTVIGRYFSEYELEIINRF
ncbi:MAG: hypothetical protein ACT4OH_03425 [Methylophilaceae bacterium]